MITPIILCGGSGARLWPLSRITHPKQLLSLVDNRSMLQNTVLRTRGISEQIPPIVICNQAYRFLVAEQLKEVDFGHADLFLEPAGRNTAPAITIAALHVNQKEADSILLVMPADHVISDEAQFAATVQEGAALAYDGYLVTFGVLPNKAETGYGYILRGDPLPQSTGYLAKRFVEKPPVELAESYVASNNYFWNSGIFMFRVSTLLQAVCEFAPDILASCQNAFADVTSHLNFYQLKESFLTVRSESIDYAVLEKSRNIAVVPLRSEWSDVGSWDALWEIGSKDQQGNVLHGQVYVDKVNNSYLRAEKRLLAVVGLSDIAVVETSDAILVAHKDSCQSVKSMVNLLQSDKCEAICVHRRVHRPWGYYEILNRGDDYQVKHILVKPGAKLSLQMHRYRSEHWVITKGTARVTRDDACFELSENQSVYIPAMTKHRIENESVNALELVEVQTGQYLGEDDIIRFEDMYDREKETAIA
jgi:mannose-1-phosphate guanylyltransferase/mannose-6-phosphate isomerase